MAFDQPTRNRLQKFVSDARELLTKEFRLQLQSEYGMDPGTGEVSTLEVLAFLDDNRRETARLLRETLEHYLAGDSAPSIKECLDRIVREQSFTVLNRLCALRMAEARGILIESIGNGYQSRGFQLYARLAGSALGETGDAYRCYLFSIFDEFALDLAVLFDRFSPQGRLFPGESTLLVLLGMINQPDIVLLWPEDETIGWIYQYFNSPEERKQMRADSQAPRNSRELAVRNQFFTPRYVVEFLTDNTLGRTWYEMTKGNTELKEQCRYLVRRPNEIFLAEGEEVPQQNEPAENLSQEELLKQPVYIPCRRLKDPREIIMLDPACGSMHFGLYAFDLFEKIYEEAWELEDQVDTGVFARSKEFKPLRETYESKEALLWDVPRLIIEHNIHGIDIDPRAVQIAGLSLWLRAQRSWQAQGIKPEDRTQILKSNIVCAEPMPGEKEMLQEFAENLKPRVLGQLVEIIFDKMQLAGEAGSLLKIEEEIQSAIAKAREDFNDELLYRREAESTLFPELLPSRQLSLFDFADMPDETQFWRYAEKRILSALREHAEQADSIYSHRKRLFSQDAARGFAFIDICRKRYDVVLMNPPFGEYSSVIKDYVTKNYPKTKQDIGYCMFSRTIDILGYNGKLGIIINRTGFFISELMQWRSSVLLEKNYISSFLDIGYGVLDDALVEVALINVEKSPPTGRSGLYIGILDEVDKALALDLSFTDENKTSFLYWLPQSVFRMLPECQLTYWVSPKLIRKLFKHKRLKQGEEGAQHGMSTKNDFRFLRATWEVSPNIIGQNKKWILYAKGGEYQPYYDDIHLVVDWAKGGGLIESYVIDKYPYLKGNANWVMHFECDYYKAGLTYPERTTSDFSPRILPSGCIFSVVGQSIFFTDLARTLYFLGLSYSRPLKLLIESLVGSGDSSVSGSAARHYKMGLINMLPVSWPSYDNIRSTAKMVRKLVELARFKWVYNSTSRIYSGFCRTVQSDSLHQIAQNRFAEAVKITIMALKLHYQIEQQYFDFYKLDRDDKDEIRRLVGPHPYELGAESTNASSVVETLYVSSDKLVALAREKIGGSRQVTKKSYIWDRDIELVCLIYQINPDVLLHCIEMENRGIARSIDYLEIAKDVIDFLFGAVYGRWDIRIVLDLSYAPKLPDLFDTLPACPPAMINYNGLPVGPENISDDYPLKITWSGILVDDVFHQNDIERRVLEGIEVIWKDKAESVEQEACEILSISSLRDYFSKPGNFFADHLKRYSKSRRQAPIYWPLSTSSGSYTIWLYYHRLTDQTLYTCVNDFVEPKLKVVSESASRLRRRPHCSSAEEKELERLNDLELELKDLRDELLRIAAFWKPDLNDGVQITAAPLWKLFRYTPWQKTLKETWGKLERGDYDWAHLAYSIWPQRVREKCKKDKSLAIAHDLEDLYEEQPVEPKKRGRGRRAKKQ